MGIRCIHLQRWCNNTYIIGTGYHIADIRFYQRETQAKLGDWNGPGTLAAF